MYSAHMNTHAIADMEVPSVDLDINLKGVLRSLVVVAHPTLEIDTYACLNCLFYLLNI